MKRFTLCLLFSVAAVLGFASCSTSRVEKPAATANHPEAFASPTQLTATLTNGDNILLTWKTHATAAGGNWVEFATPGSEFVKLQVFLSGQNGTTYLHPNLAPQTTFIYHVLPFFGQHTPPVEITTGNTSTTNTPVLAEGPIPSTNNVAGQNDVPKYSIRTLRTFAKAAPADLTATLSSPTSVDLRWKDRASDEDGFLVEISPNAAGPFYVCALLPANTTSFRKTGLPLATKCYFRVRAYFYGKPSNQASATTPPWNQTKP